VNITIYPPLQVLYANNKRKHGENSKGIENESRKYSAKHVRR
jgi:hypothetical protein